MDHNTILKKGAFIYITLFIVGICLCFGCILLFHRNTNKKLNNEEITTKEETSKEIVEGNDNYESDNDNENEALEEKENQSSVSSISSNSEKKSLWIDHILKVSRCSSIGIYVTDKKVETKDIDSLALYHVIEKNDFYGKKASFSLTEAMASLKKYFYGTIHFDPNSIDYNDVSCPAYQYDSESQTFNKQQTACGGTCGPVYYNVIQEEKVNDTLKVTIKVLFFDYDNKGNTIYYSDYQHTKVIGELDADPKELYDQGSSYLFTFQLVDGSYAFVSSEPI